MKYLRRLIWFIATRLLVICCVLALVVTAFYFSMNATNIYIIVKDGMAKRAQVILMGADEDLTPYFANTCLERDADLQTALNSENSYYQYYYSITGIDHRITLNWFWCWPWEDTARATVTERIPAIDGRLRSSVRELAESNGVPATPQWQSAQYSLILTRENGLWHVKNMTLQKLVND